MLHWILASLISASTVQDPTQTHPESGALVVFVEGVRDGRGVVRVEICTAQTFLGEHCELSRSVRAQKGAVTAIFSSVPAGPFAIQAYHDANEDGTLDRGYLGMPTEEFGFSGSPPLGLRGPLFTRAAFVHGLETQSVTVRLRGVLRP